MTPLISVIITALVFAAIVGWVLYATSLKVCQVSDGGHQAGRQYIKTDKTLPSHLALKFKAYDAKGNLVEDIEFFKGGKNPRYLVKKPITPGVYSYELEGNKFLFTATVSLEAGDCGVSDAINIEAEQIRSELFAAHRESEKQIDNALALADDMTARIDAVSAAANDALKNCFVYNSDSARYYREKRQSGILMRGL